jgi:N-acetylmuramoyl-L-alanine amidase
VTHEILRDGQPVDVWDELDPAGDHPVVTFNPAAVRLRARRQVTVVIQKGHCFRTRGSTGAPGEQAFNHHVVDEAAIEAAGYIEAVGHRARIVLADDQRYPAGDVFVAVHFDGSVNPTASGASVGYPDAAGAAVAARWKAAYRQLGWTRGFRGDNYTTALSGYYGYSRARAAGIAARMVVEAGFGSNPGDRAFLDSARGRTACAAAICIATTGINPLTPTQPEEGDMALKDTMKFIQAPGTPVFLVNIETMKREGIESHDARLGIAQVFGLDPNPIQVHGDVIQQFRDAS